MTSYRLVGVVAFSSDKNNIFFLEYFWGICCNTVYKQHYSPVSIMHLSRSQRRCVSALLLSFIVLKFGTFSRISFSHILQSLLVHFQVTGGDGRVALFGEIE